MEKTIYKTPTVKVVEFKAERGFAGSFGLQRATESSVDFEQTLNEESEACGEQYFERDASNFWD